MMRKRRTTLPIGLLLSGLVVFAGCTGEQRGDGVRRAGNASWAELRRPLRIDALETAARCPVSPARVLSSQFALGQGKGPVYPLGAAGGLKFTYPVEPTQVWYPSEWSGNKVAWVARTGFADAY